MGQSYKYSFVSIQNPAGSTADQSTMGASSICIGNDASSPTAVANTCPLHGIHDGGFQDLALAEGRYFYIYRDGDTNPF